MSKVVRFFLSLVVMAFLGVKSSPLLAQSTGQGWGFGLIGVQGNAETDQSWRPLLASLGSELGTELRADVDQDYAAIIWGMHSGRDKLAWLGNKSAIEAVDRADAEVFAQIVPLPGQPGYRSLLIAPVGAAFGEAKDVMGHAAELTLGMADVNSTSGYLAPRYYLFGPSIDPDKLFKRVVHQNHEENILAVADGRVDVAVVSSQQYERYSQSHPDILAKIRVVWRSPLLPGDPLLWSKALPKETRQKILVFFLNYAVERPGKAASQLAEERAVLKRLGYSHFVGSDDRQLIPIRQMSLFDARLRIEVDQSLIETERTRRLRDIDRKLAELSQFIPPSN